MLRTGVLLYFYWDAGGDDAIPVSLLCLKYGYNVLVPVYVGIDEQIPFPTAAIRA